MRSSLAGLAGLALLVPLLASGASAAPLDELDDYPRPAVSGAAIADDVEAFASGHPLRITGTPTQLTAVEALAAEARSFGYAVETTSYKGVLTSVTATKKGTDRADEHLVFGAHLDSMVGTITGTYDDGSGVRTVIELARAFKDVPTHRTLVFSWYNGEEEGALGSAEHAAAFAAAGKKVAAYLGFDMVGIAWPLGPDVVPSDKDCLCMWRGSRDAKFDKLLTEINYGYLGFPKGKRLVSVEGANVRNSDEASWADQGYPTLRWGGQRKAADYPGYHMPNDDMATIEAEAGGREFFGKGLRNTLLSAYYTAAKLDLVGTPAPTPVPVAPGARTADRRAAHTPFD
ncbi:MAG: aminopeptidase, partial [Frankiales bacterium]|nr:aminopeptidase [Frankiales bacterium]